MTAPSAEGWTDQVCRHITARWVLRGVLEFEETVPADCVERFGPGYLDDIVDRLQRRLDESTRGHLVLQRRVTWYGPDGRRFDDDHGRIHRWARTAGRHVGGMFANYRCVVAALALPAIDVDLIGLPETWRVAREDAG